MILKLGIGIATFNRRDILLGTLHRVLTHTQHPYAIVVADDGSSDGTADAVRTLRVPVIQGINHGAAWNKNRALFYLVDIVRCDIVLLLEDDTFPIRDGWEMDWMRAAGRYGAVYFPRDVAASAPGQGDGPIRSSDPHTQCAAFSREAILFGGYLDSRFVGAGFESAEHAQRLLRAGYGGEPVGPDGGAELYYLMRGGVSVAQPPSHVTPASLAGNRRIAAARANDPGTCLPWTDLRTMRDFRAEMASVAPRAGRHLDPEEVTSLGGPAAVAAPGADPIAPTASPRPNRAAPVPTQAAKAPSAAPSPAPASAPRPRRRSS